MKFRKGDIVQHKISKEKYVIISKAKWFECLDGKLIIYKVTDKFTNTKYLYEDELESSKEVIKK